VSLYLVVPPSDISRTKPLIRLMLNQIGRRLTESLKGERRARKLLLMLDEFPTLGRLDFFEAELAFIAGYGIRAFLIAQSLNQIERAYGANNAILDNCHVRVAFSTNDERTAKRISDALGTATELRAQRNYAGHRLSPWLGHLMVSRQETARQLLTPGEIMQLPPEDEIVMVSGHPPVRARKLRYFLDSNFTRRVLPPPSPEANASDRPSARPDDWSTLPAPAVLLRDLDSIRSSQPGESDGGGLSREPRLESTPEQLPAEPAPAPTVIGNEWGDTLETGSEDPLRRAARLAVLDPEDGLPL
jgi:type IV secretion system protein VirD4